MFQNDLLQLFNQFNVLYSFMIFEHYLSTCTSTIVSVREAAVSVSFHLLCLSASQFISVREAACSGSQTKHANKST